MKYLHIIIGMALAAITFTGCSDEGTQANSELTGSTYTGVIPCADCQGINYRLSLKEDQQYETSSVYIGESNRAFTERGKWSLQDDSLLYLNKGEKNARQFKIGNNKLVMLDKKGNEVSGSLAPMYVLNRADSSVVNQRWEDWREQGIDFHAGGNEPSWSLNIDFDKMMKFTTLNGDSIQTPVPQMQQDTASKARVWNAEVESGTLKVKLFPTGCMDSMSGDVSDYAVTVEYGDELFKGCGSFITEAYKLNDAWRLDQINGLKIHQTNMAQQVPILQFNLTDEKIFGNAGCNQLNGGFSRDGKDLSFSTIATTKRACPGNMESRFLEALNRVDGYDIANSELLLMNQKDTLMVFQRAE